MTSVQETAERALGFGRAGGSYVAIVDETAAAHLRWARNALTSNGSTRVRDLTVVAFVGAGAGVAAGAVSLGGAADDDALRELVRAAERAAEHAGPAPDAAPPVRPGPDDPGWERPPEEVTVDALRGAGAGLGALLARFRAAGRELYGYAEQQARTTYLASSTGLRRRHAQRTALADLTARDRDGRSTWDGTGGEDLSDLDLHAAGDRLADRLAWAGRRLPRPPGRYEVLLSPACVADLMMHVYLAAGATAAADGGTVFSRPGGGTRIGDRLSALPLTLSSDPAEPGLRCAPFVVARSSSAVRSVFDNGLPLARTDWIAGGRLEALVQTRRSAADSGRPLTPEVDNLTLRGPGRATLPEMVAGTRRGLLVNSLWYLRDLDPRQLLLTGVTRDGVYVVEDGEVVGEADDFRFNESPVALLDRVAEAGATERTMPREWGDYFTRTAMPPLRIADFAMSAVSRWR
ncbi:metallopeptidase TldD-related protein [Dactylosporangium sp. CA-139066]|uniref:metallopeptidase TldD-related protein n=1 Tax=Dactylosporangium sp. CA-139066 TaxID=3239930 RepID=UPI003D90DE83